MGIKIKPEKRAEFLEIIKQDGEHSVADESGCVRGEVLEDASVANPFYFCEVYRDQAALGYQCTTPHFKIWADKSPGVAGRTGRLHHRQYRYQRLDCRAS